MSEAYDPDNLLDRRTPRPTMELQYEHMRRREAELLGRRLGLNGGEVLSVGCGWNPGRHAFPAPQWRMTGVELEDEKPKALVAEGVLDEGLAGRAGELPFEPASFDVVLYRLVLHHIAFQGPLAPVFDEAARLLRPGGALGIEHADQQGSALPALVRATVEFTDVADHSDLAGRPRFTTARRTTRD
jgi:SAM-dependent methyltransferase